jgi:ribosomal-protein-serine acetyltransferase
MAGVVGYNRIDWQNRVGYIGYWLAENYQGKGLMTSSCRAVIDYGFHSLNLNRMVIAAATENHRSRAVPERLGFIHEGTLREAEWLYDHFVDHAVLRLSASGTGRAKRCPRARPPECALRQWDGLHARCQRQQRQCLQG